MSGSKLSHIHVPIYMVKKLGIIIPILEKRRMKQKLNKLHETTYLEYERSVV